ncbi:FBD-associated F-box protein At1g61320 [Linum grandiflorum]
MANNVELNESITLPIQTEELGLMHPRPQRTRRGASGSTSQQNAECNDFLSLPNELLEKILGSLGIRQLVMLSVVAKQFRHCFKYGKVLDFDLSFRRALGDTDQYLLIVRHMMDQHVGSKIQSLKLRFSPAYYFDNHAMVVDWINKAGQKGVEELELNFDRGFRRFRITADLLFKIKTLKTLCLVFVELGLPITEFQVTGLQFLKVFSIKKSFIDGVHLDALFKACTELEFLEIINCHTPTHLKFSARNLTKFKVVDCTILAVITIDTPSLTTMHYAGDLILFNFENCANLVDFLYDLKPKNRLITNLDHVFLDKLMFHFIIIEVFSTTNTLLEILYSHSQLGTRMDSSNSLFMVKEINLTLERSSRCDLFAIAYFFNKFFCERIFIDVRSWLQVS